MTAPSLTDRAGCMEWLRDEADLPGCRADPSSVKGPWASAPLSDGPRSVPSTGFLGSLSLCTDARSSCPQHLLLVPVAAASAVGTGEVNPDGLSQEPGQAGLCPDVPSYVPWPSGAKGHCLPTSSVPRLRVQCILGSPILEAAQQLVTSVLQALGVGEWFNLRGVLGGPSSSSRECVPSTTCGGPPTSLQHCSEGHALPGFLPPL